MNNLKFQHEGIEYNAQIVKLSEVSFGEDKVFHLSISGVESGWHMGLFQMDFNFEPDLTELVMDMIAKNFDVENVVEADGKLALFLEDADRNIAGLISVEGHFYKTPVLRSAFKVASLA